MIFPGIFPTNEQVGLLRLLLSTYQDGTGQTEIKGIGTLPNWRDFERSVAIVFNGQAQESKAFYDVLVPKGATMHYGISCKMKNSLVRAYKQKILYIEVSNSAGAFIKTIEDLGGNINELKSKPNVFGPGIINSIENRHEMTDYIIDVQSSYYLVLHYSLNKKELHKSKYRLYLLPLRLKDPSTLEWQMRPNSKCLIGKDPIEGRTIYEIYISSGGQLKYHPAVAEAIWQSEEFDLEPLPYKQGGYGILQRTKEYFPSQWEKLTTN